MRAISLFALLLIPFQLNAAQPASDAAALEGAVTFMGDSGDGTGVWLTDWLRDHRARYEFSADIAGKSSRRIDTGAAGKVPVIILNSSTKGDGNAYAYYAVLIAREAAGFIHMGMPESAEKRYMENSCMAEVYFELYGTRADLPLIGGVRDEEAAAQINSWVWDGPDSGPDSIARDGKYKTISVLQDEARTALELAKKEGRDTAALEAELDSLGREKAYYDKEFRQRENYWWTLYQPK